MKINFTNMLKMRPIHLFLAFSMLVFSASSVHANKSETAAVENFSMDISISGRVTDENGEAVIGANILLKGTSNTGTVTDVNGDYSITVPEGSTLVFSAIGFTSKEVPVNGQSTLNVTMNSSATSLSEIVVVGSRNANRSSTDTPVPVDVIDMKELSATSAKLSVNQILNYVAPSFTSNTQTISDGTDHIDPASLRGLGPDQVLVLINGKRRHSSSLVNVNGTFGRGNVGTDLNAIPVASIQRIEVLRDGAAAQYGSDAIAGVINIVLKRSVNELTIDTGVGAHISKNSEDGMDGEEVHLNMNYGLPIGDGGFINFTGNYNNRDYTNRMKEFKGKIFEDYNNPTDFPTPTGEDITESELTKRGLTRSDFNMRVGQSAVENAGAFVNMSIPLGEKLEFYSFGGLTYRRGDAAGFYRLPYQSRAVTSIYPNGFLPEIHSNINDKSLAIGIKGSINDWKIDFSNTAGSNRFLYQIENTLNASLEGSSPTSINSGGFQFAQNTTNFDVTRFYEDIMSGFNIAFGAEYRVDNYQIFAGEEVSYTNYGLASWQVSKTGDSTLVVDHKGPINTVFGLNGTSARPGGAQVFPGFSPDNEVNAFRSSVGLYVDAEADITESFLLTGAVRFENYSDFGSTLNGKVSFRAKLSDAFSLRGALSSGFRAPSLHQLHFNSTSTIFVDGIPSEVGTFSNDSRPAKLLGIPKLKEETSTNVSLGLTADLAEGLALTVDGYLVNIKDRVVYTGQFSGSNAADASATDKEIFRLLAQANATKAAFFANAIDTKTSGLDVVLTHKTELGKGNLRTSLAGTFSKTELDGDIKSSPQLAGKESTYFDRTSRIYLEAAVPRTKFNLTFNYTTDKFNVMLRNVYFGEVEEATNNIALGKLKSETNAKSENLSPAKVESGLYNIERFFNLNYSNKIVTDLSVSFNIDEATSFVIGANNILDIYPDEADKSFQSSGRFLYSRRSQQFGANGRYVFARLSFTLK